MEFSTKIKSVKIHYSTDCFLLFLYMHYSNSFRVNTKISIHSFSERPCLYLCQLPLGFTVEFWRKWNSKYVTMHYIALTIPWHLYRHYSNSFRVNMTINIHTSSQCPRLCLCLLSRDFTVDFVWKIIAKSVTIHCNIDHSLTFLQAFF